MSKLMFKQNIRVSIRADNNENDIKESSIDRYEKKIYLFKKNSL